MFLFLLQILSHTKELAQKVSDHVRQPVWQRGMHPCQLDCSNLLIN